MSSTFPTSLDSFTSPISGATLAENHHAQRHIDLQDSIAAIEAKVGVDSSAVTSSLDYKVSVALPSSINSVSASLTETQAAIGYPPAAGVMGVSYSMDITQTGIVTTTTPTLNLRQSVATLLDTTASNTGTDTTLSTLYRAVKFICPAAPNNTVGDIMVRLKKSGTFTNPEVHIFGDLYSDAGGLPGSKLTNITVGATIFGGIGSLPSSYADIPLGFNRITLTPGVAYWIVIRFSSPPAGASVLADSTTGSGAGSATSPDGTNWTLASGDMAYKVRGQDYCAVYAVTDTNVAVYGRSVDQSGVAGFSDNNSAVNGLSKNSYGVAGVSDYSIGVFGVSKWSIGVQGISTNSQAGSFGVNGTLTQNSSNAGFIVSRTTAAAGYNVTGPLVRFQDNVTGAGTWQASLIEGMIGSTDRFHVRPLVTNVSGQIAYLFDTAAALSTPGVRLASWKNNAVEKAWIGHDGSVRAQRFSPAVSSDRGDASVTLTVSSDAEVQRFSTTLTADRTITLSTTGAFSGDQFHIVRSADGAFTLDLGGLKSLAASTWAKVKYDGSAWFLAEYGSL